MRTTLLGLFASAAICLSAQAQQVTQAGRTAQKAAQELSGAVRNLDMSWMVDHMYPPVKRMYAMQHQNKNSKQMIDIYMGRDPNGGVISPEQMNQAHNNLRREYLKSGEALKRQGVRVESFTIGAPLSEYELSHPDSFGRAVVNDAGKSRAEEIHAGKERSRLVILPTTLIISAPIQGGARRARAEKKSYLIAVRDEVITDKSNPRDTVLNTWYFIDANTDTRTLRTFFPDLPHNLNIPVESSRELQ